MEALNLEETTSQQHSGVWQRLISTLSGRRRGYEPLSTAAEPLVAGRPVKGVLEGRHAC